MRATTGHTQINYGPSTGRYIDNDKHPLDWANCGTEANHRAHLRRGQIPCDPCLAAHNRRRYEGKAHG